jgi:hypothetical protein
MRARGAAIDAVVIYDDVTSTVRNPLPDEGDLWLTPAALQQATGFLLKPEGACLGDVCVPFPEAERHIFFRNLDGQTYFNLSALARVLEQPTVCDVARGIWAFGPSPASQRKVLRTLEAPNFTLPDWNGTIRSLAEFRGRKVLLLTWASW